MAGVLIFYKRFDFVRIFFHFEFYSTCVRLLNKSLSEAHF